MKPVSTGLLTVVIAFFSWERTTERYNVCPPPTSVRAGEEPRIAGDGSAMRRLEFDPTQRVAWRERQVIFNGDTLADIAQDFNRYNRTPRIRGSP